MRERKSKFKPSVVLIVMENLKSLTSKMDELGAVKSTQWEYLECNTEG